ncbi:MAG TPA: hypothetical protein V6C76_09730 [Drouetiella sp.]
MIPLGLLGQVYAVCAGIGSIFVIASFVLGHVEMEGHDVSGHDDGGSDFGASDDGGGNDFGAGDDSGGGDDFGAGNDGGGQYRLSNIASGSRVVAAHHATSSPFANGVLSFLLTLLSPMTVSVYLAFFGLTGLLLALNAPWLGYLTLVPSVIVSIVVSAAFKSMTQWMIKNMHSSTHQKDSDLLGQVADVNIPISIGRTGEVTYVLNTKLMTASAKPAKEGLEFKKGSKVLIVGSKDHVVFVEPYDTEDELEKRFNN